MVGYHVFQLIECLRLLLVPMPFGVLLEEGSKWSCGFRVVWKKLREVSYHAEESLEFLLALRGCHVSNGLNFLGVGFDSLFTDDVTNVADFVLLDLALVLVKLEVS